MAVDTRYVTHDKWTSLTATQVTYPNGRQVSSGYDALYRRNSITETSGGGSIATWDFFGNRTARVSLGNGITCSFMNNAQTNSAVQVGVPNPAWGDKTTDRLGYDGSGRLIAKRFLPSGSTTSLVGSTTGYDPSSNKVFERSLQAESRSTLYPQYDSMDRLREYQRGVLASGGASIATSITLPGTDNQRDYNLDSLGNWKSTVFTPEGTTTPTTEVRQHNKLNEITLFNTTPVLYDHGNNAGNPNPLIAQRGNGNIADDGSRLYAYDALNRLITVKRKSDNAQVAEYTYDALGRRVLKVVTNGGLTGTIANATYRYIYDGQQIVEELLFASGSYTTLRQFVWGQYIDELIQFKVPGTTTAPPLTAGTYYPLGDPLYRTSAATDSGGAIIEAYDYDAYGNTIIFKAAGTGGNWWADDAVPTLQPACEYLFTGRQYDPETQIYFFRRRYYGQFLGRFFGRDAAAAPILENLYQYAVGNPVNSVDPLGLKDKKVANTQPTTQNRATKPADTQPWNPITREPSTMSRCRVRTRCFLPPIVHCGLEIDVGAGQERWQLDGVGPENDPTITLGLVSFFGDIFAAPLGGPGFQPAGMRVIGEYAHDNPDDKTKDHNYFYRDDAVRGPYSDLPISVCKCLLAQRHIRYFNVANTVRYHTVGTNSNWALHCYIRCCHIDLKWGFWGPPAGWPENMDKCPCCPKE